MKRKIRIDNVVSVAELAHAMGQKSSVVMKELIGLGQMVTVNDMLDIETAELVANEFEYTVENVGYQEDLLLQQVEEAEKRPTFHPVHRLSPSWATSTTARRRCSMGFGKHVLLKAKPAALPSTSVRTR
jgi:hypothetical protein